MRIITDNEEVFDIPDENVLNFDASVHEYMHGADSEFKRYINRLDLKIKSTKDITCNGVVSEGDLDFAIRTTRYNDIRIIEFKGVAYKIVWKHGKRSDLNPLQASDLNGNRVSIHIKAERTFKKNKEDRNN